MFILRSSISVQVSKKIFGMINKRGVQISICGLKNNSKNNKRGEGGGDAYLAFKSNSIGTTYFGLYLQWDLIRRKRLPAKKKFLN